MALRAKVGFGGCFALAILAIASQCRAEPASLREFLFGANRNGLEGGAPAVARYQADGGLRFILDRSAGRHAALKFDDSPEIWSLTASPGPRGDVIYRNDMGVPVLRATRLGGLTLFTPGDPGGAAAAALGAAPPPRLQQVYGPEALFQVLLQAGEKASRAARHLIVFDAGDASVTPATEALFADAFVLTADAIVRVSGRSGGRGPCQRLARVQFVQGPDAAAVMMGRIFQVTVAPDLGVAGRPSSERIAAALFRR